ncbi:MAG: DUF3565 domain-containing protein [Myxococcota bacterium]
MRRPITGFHRDEAGDFVAELSCGHGQHVRHDPPLVERPWVLSEEGRASRLGDTLDCVRCDARELPEGYEAFRRTRSFDADSLPDALRSRHDTKAGIWARIHVTAGEVTYRVHEPYHTQERLTPAAPGTVLPEVPHELSGDGTFQVYVEFWRRRR